MTVPRVFGQTHLSEDAVAAFADGVLAAAAAMRAERHCAECSECAEAVRGQREMAMMLRATTAPALPSGLMDRLAGVPMSTPLPPPMSGLPTVLGADGVPMFATHKPASQDEPGSANAHSMLRRGALPMGLLASAAAVVAAGAFGSQLQSVASTGVQQQAPASISQVAANQPPVQAQITDPRPVSFGGRATALTELLLPTTAPVRHYAPTGRMRATP
jgi:anti-sigma factor RsiW